MPTKTVCESYPKSTAKSDVEALGQQRVDQGIAIKCWVQDDGDNWQLCCELEVAE